MARRISWPLRTLLVSLPIVVAACTTMQSGGGGMSFFVTSAGSGKGADLGGLAGADKHCQTLAAAAGAGNKNWRAYLSTQGKDGVPTVNAKGEVIARDVQHLHGVNNISKQTALNEKGQVVEGRGDTPNRHDILTGTRADGTAFSPGDTDMTCGNWTRSGAEGVTMVGHHDRQGPTTDPWATSWNSSHQSRGGCSLQALKGTGGDGLLYCFAAN